MTASKLDIHAALAAVLADMPGIGKDGRNQTQNFNYRGIDQVTAALKPILVAHGVIIVPRAEAAETGDYTSRSGALMHRVMLRVGYRIYGPDGSYIEAASYGEGTDSGDKATSKAMTMAFKYLLFELLCIADPEDDADKHSPEEGIPSEVSVPVTRTGPRDKVSGNAVKVKEALAAAPEEYQAELRALYQDKWGNPGNLTAKDFKASMAWVEEEIQARPF